MIFSLYMMMSPVKQKQNVADWVFSSVLYLPQSVASYVLYLGAVSEENVILKKQNAKLKLEIDLIKEYAIENERLKKLLNFENHWDYPIFLTQIIGHNPGPYMTTVVVNKGSSDSIFYGMPVFTVNGLVGKVSKAFRNHSMIQLLSDPNSRISVISQRSRALGTVFSRDNGEIQIQVSSYTDLVPGDTLVTSGFGGIYPKGIPVGVLVKFDKNDSEVLSYGNIKLLQQIESLEEVFIIRKDMDWIIWDGK
ncbi:MAG: rod shape-determining protein MreC [Fibromonadaceae bacterium]|nr:rod shape-determining protein MreC [Fibromonadaceae bacterium]